MKKIKNSLASFRRVRFGDVTAVLLTVVAVLAPSPPYLMAGMEQSYHQCGQKTVKAVHSFMKQIYVYLM